MGNKPVIGRAIFPELENIIAGTALSVRRRLPEAHIFQPDVEGEIVRSGVVVAMQHIADMNASFSPKGNDNVRAVRREHEARGHKNGVGIVGRHGVSSD